jgi:hypothetical protein
MKFLSSQNKSVLKADVIPANGTTISPAGIAQRA